MTPGDGSNDEYPTFYAIIRSGPGCCTAQKKPAKPPAAAPVAVGYESPR
jgi:hypothetical protein